MLRVAYIERSLPQGWSVQAYDEVESTNFIIKEALSEGCSEGLVATALVQGGGYGRQGRTWESPLGGLYASFALRPLYSEYLSGKRSGSKRSDSKCLNSKSLSNDYLSSEHVISECSDSGHQHPNTLNAITREHLPTLSLVVALALHQTLQRLDVPGIQIKWPNDVLIDGAKVCGISLEAVRGGVCVGIGINVFPSAKPSTRSLSYSVAYVGSFLARAAQKTQRECSINPEAQTLSSFQTETLEQLLTAFLTTFIPLYDTWLVQGFATLREEYNAHLFNIGEVVALETITHHTLLEGVVEGVDKEGRLLLKQCDGRIIPAVSGEVHTLHKG